MTDPIAAPEAELTPASPTPVLSAAEIETLIARKAQELTDTRVAGLQSLFDKKLSAIQADIRKTQRGNLVADDDDPRIAELEADLARAQREAALARAAGKYPDAFPLYEQIIGIEDTDAQIAALDRVIKELRAPAPLAPTPEPQPEPPAPALATPSVDPNNPPRQSTTGGVVYEVGGKSLVMDENTAARLLGFIPKGFKRG